MTSAENNTFDGAGNRSDWMSYVKRREASTVVLHQPVVRDDILCIAGCIDDCEEQQAPVGVVFHTEGGFQHHWPR